MHIYLSNRLVIGKLAIAIALLATPALAFDSHPPLRDDGARWAAANMPTAMPRAEHSFDSHPPLRDDGARWAATNTPTAMPRPAEDQGMEVITLGVISEAALMQHTGLAGHVLRLSTVTLAPGGQLADQGTASGPGFLVVTGGEWTEGVPGIERVHTSLVAPALTTGPQPRWYFNRGATPATALVIEIIPRAVFDVAG